jgi:FixJ family two-component response regulator
MRRSRGRGVLVAVVDDNDAVRHAISSLVRSAGYDCVAFGSAEGLLKFGDLCKTDCILLDIRMPGIDGLDLHLRLHEMNRRIPVIYQTAVPDDVLRERAFRQGAVAFLTKPFHDEELLSAIHDSLHG